MKNEPRELPSREVLKSLFRYSPRTGVLFWQKRPLGNFNSERAAKSWNTRYADAKAGSLSGPYIRVRVEGKFYLSHRLIWKLYHGVEPDYVDHIDGNGRNNRLRNLRSISFSENGKNRRIGRNNSSGHLGVCFCKKTGRWDVTISDRGKTVYLGGFDKFEDAVRRRRDAEVSFSYHKNHGRPG